MLIHTIIYMRKPVAVHFTSGFQKETLRRAPLYPKGGSSPMNAYLNPI
jgi:hypothetical protein